MFESCHVQSRIQEHTTRNKEIVEVGLIFLVFFLGLICLKCLTIVMVTSQDIFFK